MKPIIKQTCYGQFKVAYEIRDCFSQWRGSEAHLPPECSYCLLNEGIVAFCSTEEEAKKYAFSLPNCSAPLVSSRKDELSTRLL